MEFLFSTGSLWTYSVDRTFAFASEAGFDGIELMIDQRWEGRQVDYLRRLSDEQGIAVKVVHSPFSPSIPGWPADEAGRIARSLAIAEELGASVVVHHLPTRFGVAFIAARGKSIMIPYPSAQAGKYRDWLDGPYGTLQDSTDVKLCIENMPAKEIWGRKLNPCLWNTPDEIGRFTNLTLDTTHLGTWGLDPSRVYQQLVDQVKHVHLSNFDGSEHRRPEDGHLDLERFVRQVAAAGQVGTVTLELKPDALDAGEADEHIIELMGNSLELCRTWVSGGRAE